MNSFYKNQYLFSEIYLKEITDFPEKPEITSTLNTLKEYKEYADTNSLTEWKSTFIQKVFGVLGFGYSSVDDNIIKLFRPGETDKPISVCYALLPNENLDNDTIGSHWSEKIIRNLEANELNWGLLTNGNMWRIYHVDEPSPYETYLQIDLSEILEKDDTKNYMIFFEFMKADNFIKDDEGNCKFDKFKEESFEKIEYIEEELKDALRQREGEDGKGVLNDICMGYIEYLRSKGKNDFSDEDFRKEIYSGAMLYMFRLLFIFYATARELLTQEEIDSFREILKKSKALHKTPDAKRDSNKLWEGLRELFAIIEVHYNGGLFDPEEHKFIENTRISDYFLTRVLYNMNFYKDDYGNEQPISYRDMGVRHLGTLYEGLLEHKLYVAEEDTQVKIEKGAVKFIPKSQGGAIVEGNYIPKGEVYFAGDKGERKSTGSYYTPEYIVDYIVTNTVGEKLKELKDEFVKESESLFDDINSAVDKIEKSRFTSYLEEQILSFTKKKILKLSVLDPAMGSGHFLVNATNKIANFITEFLNEYNLTTEQTSSTVYWRRRVVENCIYGVDINPLAVELAKLSLWILSMAKDAHLSFLNHHLKCGNSLIGARLSDIGIYPGNKQKTKKGELSLWDKDENFKQTVEKVISDYFAIEERETKNKDDIEFKKELLDDINDDLALYKKVCDLHTDINFDETIDESYYFSKLKTPQTIEAENNSYFHWELEFPEIFRSHNGFNCVVGNPPWGASFSTEEKDYLIQKHYDVHERTPDSFNYFLHLFSTMLNNESFLGYIIPNVFLFQSEYSKSRQYYLSNELFFKVVNCGDNVFDVIAPSCIIILNSTSGEYFEYLDIRSIQRSNKPNALMDIGKKFTFNELLNIPQSVFQISSLDNEFINDAKSRGELLEVFADEVAAGISTGGDKIFRVSDSDAIKFNFEKELLYPVLIGRQIFEFLQPNNGDFSLIYTTKKVKLNEHPNIEKYLLPHKEKLSNKRETRKGLIPWYSLHWPRNQKLFEGNKILLRQTSSTLIATTDYLNHYCLNSIIIIRLKTEYENYIDYFVALLNSKLLRHYYSLITQESGRVFPEVKPKKLRLLPFISPRNVNDSDLKSIITVSKSLREKFDLDKINYLDKLIYKIYKLPEEQIKFIEAAFNEKND